VQDREWAEKRLVQERVEQARTLARTMRRARQRAGSRGELWAWCLRHGPSDYWHGQTAGVYKERLQRLRAERECRQQLEELLLHDRPVIDQLLREAGMNGPPLPIL
jgi:hypothetical protein